MGTIILIAIIAGATFVIYKAVSKDSAGKPSGTPSASSGSSRTSNVQRTAQRTYSSPQAGRAPSNAANTQKKDAKKSKYNLPSAY